MNPTTHTKRMPRISLLLVFIAIALTAALYAITAHSGPDRPHAASPKVALAAGTLSVGNSNNGSAFMSLGGFKPGPDSQSGTVTISNGGSLPGAFTLSKSVTGGGALADLLHVVISDGSTTVYDGTVGGMGTLDLGSFAAGASKTYTFTVDFPDHGTPSSNTSGDNAGRGVTAVVDYTWAATADDPAGSGTAGANGTNGSGGALGGVNGSGNGTLSSLLTLAGAGSQKPFKQGNAVIVTVQCTSPCDVTAGGTLSVPNAAKAYKFKTIKKHFSKAGKAKIKLAIPKKAL